MGHVHLPPSGEGTVVLDIGVDVGALVVHTSDAMAGVEIEIARSGDQRPFVHSEVRERLLPEGAVYAAVFVSVPAGEYVLLGTGATFVVASGEVTEVWW